MKRVILLSLAVLFLMTQSSFAHHAWIEREGEGFNVGWGHPPDKISDIEPGRVKDVKAFDKKGINVPMERRDEVGKVYLSSRKEISMISLSIEGGYLVTTPDGKKRLGKREAEAQGIQIVDAVYSSQYAKSIFGYSDAVAKSAGMRFEIVPLRNPYKLKTGEALPIKVLFEGKPLKGATITTTTNKKGEKGNIELGETDKEGLANIPIDRDGMQIILASYRTPTDDPDADYLSFKTVLTLEFK